MGSQGATNKVFQPSNSKEMAVSSEFGWCEVEMKSPVERRILGIDNSRLNFKLSTLAKSLMWCLAGFDNASLQVADT